MSVKLAPTVSLQCSEGKVVHQWLLESSQVDGGIYIGVRQRLKFRGARMC